MIMMRSEIERAEAVNVTAAFGSCCCPRSRYVRAYSLSNHTVDDTPRVFISVGRNILFSLFEDEGDDIGDEFHF